MIMAKMLFDEKFVHDTAMKAIEYEFEGKTIREWIDILKEYQSSKWISVEERLPEYFVPVLAFRIHRHTPDDLYSDFCVFMRTEEYGMAERTGHYKVTHWMPLPEPPKEGTHEPR